MIDSETTPMVRLTEVFRQAAESQIMTTAHRIKNGDMPETQGKGESDFYFLVRTEPDEIRDLVIELVARRIPQKFGLDPIADVQVLCPMNRGSVGVRELNDRLQGVLKSIQRRHRPNSFH
jgi:exodeoxyribonuclease V alpha subunit